MSGAQNGSSQQKTVVVIGNGMVGQRFCEKLVECDVAGQYAIVTFCEEPTDRKFKRHFTPPLPTDRKN